MKKPSRIWVIQGDLVLKVCAAVLLLGGALVWGNLGVRRAMAPLSETVSGRCVVIDPGHGGRDPGCQSRAGLVEKDLVMDISRRVARYFRSSAVRVVLTRHGDHDLSDKGPARENTKKRRDLFARMDLLHKAKPDVFVSIHANSFPSPVWSGAQTFYAPGSIVGKNFADSIQAALIHRLGPNNRQAKAGDFLVLNEARVAAAMVEVGFLSNPREAGLLTQSRYREQVAAAIFEGVVNYWMKEQSGAGAVPSNGKAHRGLELPRKPLAGDEVALYFASPTNMDDHLLPEVHTLPGMAGEKSQQAKIRRAVEELVKGPGDKSILTSLLPATTVLRGVQIKGDVVWLDFDEHLVQDFAGGSRTEELAVASLVKTVQEIIPGAKVQITVNGETGATMGGHLVLDHPVGLENE